MMLNTRYLKKKKINMIFCGTTIKKLKNYMKELEEVKRRVASLEDRLDLVTRQLNRLLDELDEKAK